jgi:SAM-dependent methyltransferase
MPTPPSGSEYWDDRYQQGNISWDMGQVSPPLLAYFDQLTNKAISILIPGCGNAYEATYLLEKGFTSVTLVDISTVLITKLQEKFCDQPHPGPALTGPRPTPTTPAPTLIAANFFDLTGEYDLIVEQTFFCALDPGERSHYTQKAYDLLLPGGKLAGLLFDREFSGGPPFGGHLQEYRDLFEKKLRLKTLEPCYNSIKPRAGTELFLIAQKST